MLSNPVLPDGYECALNGHGLATDYAAHLLGMLGARVLRHDGPGNVHPAIACARSGLMSLTGFPNEPPQLCIAALASCAEGVTKALSALIPGGRFEGLHGAQLLTERAALSGFSREGRISPGGHCHLLDCRDGGIAVNLARDDDWTLLGAWLGLDDEAGRPDDWDAVAAEVRRHSAADLVEQGRLLGLAVAAATPPLQAAPPWQVSDPIGPRQPAPRPNPVVVDLSALWAGPLCSHLLQRAGARVIKVESTQRPDGARTGSHGFFDLLNAGKASVALDLQSRQGREQLLALLRLADIVIEGSRPRALRQLGIQAEALIAARPGLTWVSISGYGRGEPQEQWIAYGDDAGVAAGLSTLMEETTGQAVFVGDAIADPLTGLHAALLALASHHAGGGRLCGLSLRDVVRSSLQFDLPADPAGRQDRHSQWAAMLAAASVIPAPPHARRIEDKARPLGADTASVLREYGIPC